MSTDATTSLSTEPMIQRADGARSYAISPTDRLRFPYAAGADQPEFYEERCARGDGPPMHRHPWATWETVVEGSVRFVVDDEEFVATAGDFLYTPPNAVHTFVVESDTAHMIGCNFPDAPFESFISKAEAFMTAASPDMARLAALAAEHHIELMGPPLKPSGL